MRRFGPALAALSLLAASVAGLPTSPVIPPPAAPVVPERPVPRPLVVRETELRPGETLEAALLRAGVARTDALAMIAALRVASWTRDACAPASGSWWRARAQESRRV